ncbi:MAG: biopolymer transporter ExbD [bacterium]
MTFLKKKKDTSWVDFDLTPMIDAVFNLIIFFLVTLTMVKSSGISLPLAEIYEEEKKTDVIMYLYPAKVNETGAILTPGKMEVNFDEVDRENLGSKLRELKTETLVIKADQKVFYKTISEVMDIAKKSGVQKFTFAVTNEVKSGK